MRIAICDDNDFYIRGKLRPLTERAAAEANCSADITVFTDGESLVGAFERGQGFDVVLLDIDMPGINGKAAAEKLRVLDPNFFLVFVTSYRAEVFNTIPYRINAFIPKDSGDSAVTAELKRVLADRMARRPEYILFETVNGGERSMLRLTADEIFCLCCIRRKVYLKTGSREYELCSVRISELARRFADKGFFEVCRGYVVNISKIRSVNSIDLELDNGELIPLSRRRARALLGRISDYVTERANEC
ncbi:MAG: LytR/AlgR family response regulator transcription factor [Oscillospiraceae bacterium]